MVLQCYTWIQHLWYQLVCSVIIRTNGFARPLPDNIIIDILSRLPAEWVLECRKVCRLWLVLTSSSYFAEIHVKRAAPVLLVQCDDSGGVLRDELHLFIIDESAQKGKTVKKMRAGSMTFMKRYFPVLIGCCNGLVVFKWLLHSVYFVCNPVTRQHVTVTTPYCLGYLCGFFFHSLTKEFMLLFVHPEDICFEYYICSLGDTIWRKLVASPYRPACLVIPTVLNGSLHWMVRHESRSEYDIPSCSESVMIFNIYSEDFRYMPHPGKKCCSLKDHEIMHLLDKRGELYFYCSHAMKTSDIWILEDYENWFWVKKYKVNLNEYVRRYPFGDNDIFPYHWNNDSLRPLDIHNGELLLDWHQRGLLRYHLDCHTIKKINRSAMKMRCASLYDNNFTVVYMKSVFSPRGF